MSDLGNLFGARLPPAFFAAWRRLEELTGWPPSTLTCIDCHSTEDGWVVISLRVGGSRRTHRLCRRTDDLERAAKDVWLWEGRELP